MEKRTRLLRQTAVIVFLNLLVVAVLSTAFPSPTVDALSKVGSTGSEVKAIQQSLKDRGLYSGSVDGIYGSQTQAAVKKFQKQQGLTADGIAGPQTLKRLGVSVGSKPAATEANVNLLARIISAEARGEPYSGQVAVGAVILNRVEHPSFPDTLSGVIYQPGAFTGKDGTVKSRIVPTLTQGSICTDPRSCGHYVVTEYGMINLKGLSTWERAEAIISIAHPDFREQLIADAEKMHIWRRSNK